MESVAFWTEAATKCARLDGCDSGDVSVERVDGTGRLWESLDGSLTLEKKGRNSIARNVSNNSSKDALRGTLRAVRTFTSDATNA